jgi:hypothetical protein
VVLTISLSRSPSLEENIDAILQSIKMVPSRTYLLPLLVLMNADHNRKNNQELCDFIRTLQPTSEKELAAQQWLLCWYGACKDDDLMKIAKFEVDGHLPRHLFAPLLGQCAFDDWTPSGLKKVLRLFNDAGRSTYLEAHWLHRALTGVPAKLAEDTDEWQHLGLWQWMRSLVTNLSN